MAVSKQVTLRFSVNWLSAVGVVAIGLVVAFVLKPTWHETLIFAAAVAAGAGTLILAFSALDAAASQVYQQKQAVGLEFLTRWLDPPFFHAKKNGREIIKYFREHPNVDEQKEYLDGDPVMLANLFDVLNFFECASIATQTGMAEEEVIKRAFRSLVLEYWHVTGDFVKARRAERANARLFQELEWLFNRWKS